MIYCIILEVIRKYSSMQPYVYGKREADLWKILLGYCIIVDMMQAKMFTSDSYDSCAACACKDYNGRLHFINGTSCGVFTRTVLIPNIPTLTQDLS